MQSVPTPLLAFVVAIAMALPLASRAQAPGASPPGMPAWDSLTRQQREILVAPLRDRWDASPGKRPEMLQRAERWQQMTPEQRRQGRQGMQRWKDMSPEARHQMRALHGALRELPDAERAALRERWKAMAPEQRRAWVAAHPPRDAHGATAARARDPR